MNQKQKRLNSKPNIKPNYNHFSHEAATDIRYIFQLPSHSGKSTLFIHITNKAINRIQSASDRLNLKTEDKNDKKLRKKYKKSAGLTN